MKLIIAGSRNLDLDKCPIATNDFTESGNIGRIIYQYYPGADLEVVSGNSGIIDKLGLLWAHMFGLPFKKFDPDWDNLTTPGARIKVNKFGKKYNAQAGHDRNSLMADYADELLAIWDGKSAGTGNMINNMRKRGKPYTVHYVGVKK